MLRHALFEFLGTRFRALGGCCMLAKVNQRLARLGEIRRVTTRLYQRRGGEGECVGCEDVVQGMRWKKSATNAHNLTSPGEVTQ